MAAGVPQKRQRLGFNPGDLVDAMDLEGVWHEGVVRDVDPQQGYRVHFRGWSSRWDEWVETSSERIQPSYSKVRNWRPNLQVGDPVEVRSAIYPDRWLSGVVVGVDKEEEKVLCEYSHDSRWVELWSEEICLPNTHFSRELDNMSPQKVEQLFRDGPIHHAVRAGEADTVAELVDKDPTVVHQKGPLERSPLLIAADGCHLSVAKVLLSKGASLADIDRSNANCLHLAVRGPRERCPAMVKELAERGADVNGRDSRLSTPLHLVSMRGYYDVGVTLIEHGADVNARDMSQISPLRHAAYRGEEDIVRLLLRYGADPTLTDAGGGKPIDVACFLRNKSKTETVKQLLRDGHVGYLFRKMRLMLQWEQLLDTGHEPDTAIIRGRQQKSLALPRVEIQEAVPLLAENPELAEMAAVGAYVLRDMNRDLFVELTSFFV